MNTNEENKIFVSNLKEGVTGLDNEWGSLLAKGSFMSLRYHNHLNNVICKIEGEFEIDIKIFWEDKITKDSFLSWMDEEEMAQFGGAGVGILLTLKLTPYNRVRRARKGSGVDYWLGYKDNNPFQDSARLEVSGILEGNDSKINTRINERVEQTKKSDYTKLPAFIIVTEFSFPKSHVVKR